MKKRIALLGCGIWGMNILRVLQRIGCEITVFDPDEKAGAQAAKLGVTTFCTQELDNPLNFDGIVVASPSTTHRTVLEKLMPCGVPIFVEKPLTTSYTDAMALQALPHDHVFLMHIWLYHTGIQQLRDIAMSGELGEIKGVQSRRANWTSPRRDTDSIWNLAPHDITIAKAVLGHIPSPRAAVVENHQGMARGMTAMLGNDPYCVFEVSNRYERKEREVRVHGTNGIAILKDEKVNWIDVYLGDQYSENFLHEARPFEPQEPLYLELMDFLQYLDGGSKPISTFSDGLEVIKTIHELQTLANL